MGPWNLCISASLSSRGRGVGDSPEGVWQGLHTAQALLGQIWVQVLMIACLCDLNKSLEVPESPFSHLENGRGTDRFPLGC